MMVRFSCFTPVNRSKKVVQHSVENLLADCRFVADDQSIKVATGSIKSNPMFDSTSSCNTADPNISQCFKKDCWRVADLNAKHTEANDVVNRTVQITKSCSLGNMMEKTSGFSGDDVMGGVDIDHDFSPEYLNDWNVKEVRESFGNTDSYEFIHHETVGNSKQKDYDFLNGSIRNESLFSVEILKHSDNDQHADITAQTADHIVVSRCASKKPPTLARSCSMTNPKVTVAESSEDSLGHRLAFYRSRSFSSLNNLSRSGVDFQNLGRSFDSSIHIEKNIIVSPYVKPTSDGSTKSQCSFHAKEEELSLVRSDMVCNHYSNDESRELESNDAEIKQSYDVETSYFNWDQLTPEEIIMKRVEHWISHIDIRGDFTNEETGEASTSESKNSEITLNPRKPDAKSFEAMEVPQNYISSLSSASSSAHMANLGLVTVPILTPFVSLRGLDLSGNSIVRVTPGSLPKGLHFLNLSKNNISSIEGLRDLSHLRVLDLSYNRIAKIGHGSSCVETGLSSCTSLKELYIAGNKISEIEGLHRLAKLSIIDLRFNKISTAKGLGQLAANYSSMQAISIEGNPALLNVGDEQLKKFLLGLLPNLVYYNKQTIRKGSKEASGRSNFAAASSHFDRVIRAEHKLPKKASISSGLHKLAASHVRHSSAEVMPMKLTKDRLLPAASKLNNRDSSKKLLSEAMRRSESTDALRRYFKS